jgi:serine phosphatase RsbU (regulator of sigma subunit)/CheY-like chemotaxis protein
MEKARILVVEDEELVALAIKTYLDGIGHEVPLIVSSGDEAVRSIPGLEPDIVLMDIHLQGKMDGIEAATIIKDSYHIPVIYLTAYSDAGTLEQAKITEPFGYILKPFDERMLQATIEMVLYKSLMENELRRTKEKLETILKSVGDGIIVTGMNGYIEYINAAAQKLLQATEPFAKPTSVFQLFQLVDDITGNPVSMGVDEVLAEGKSVSLSECTLISKLDGRFPVDLDLEPLREEDGAIRGIVLTFRNVSERRKIRDLIDRELQDVTNIHRSLLPQDGQNYDGFEARGFILNATFGAGDLYNYYRIDDDHIGTYIIDVMGHGVAASATTLMLNRLLAPDIEGGGWLPILDVDSCEPKKVVEKLNALFCGNGNQMFFTICYGVINRKTRIMKIARAGHPYPFLFKRGGEPQELKTGGYAVGLSRVLDVPEIEFEFGPDDSILFYSDGLTECAGLHSAQFSKERLEALVTDGSSGSLESLMHRIKSEVVRWRGIEAFDDDVTVFGIRLVAD